MRYTNTYSIDIRYSRERKAAPSEVAHVDGEHLIIKDVPNFGGVQVFVSFKDNEDLELAELAKNLLNRAGIQPYLARDDVKPGSPHWDKIADEIRRSFRVLVIWTQSALADPKAILREMALAEEAKRPIVLLLEHGIDPPAAFDPDKVEYVRFTLESRSNDFARAVEAVYKRWRAS